MLEVVLLVAVFGLVFAIVALFIIKTDRNIKAKVGTKPPIMEFQVEQTNEEGDSGEEEGKS